MVSPSCLHDTVKVVVRLYFCPLFQCRTVVFLGLLLTRIYTKLTFANRAIVGALGRVGLAGVADVRQGKQFVLTIDGDIDDAKLAQINEIASTLLSNPVIEDFTVQVRP